MKFDSVFKITSNTETEKTVELQNILTDFIQTKILDYTEPTRAGTEKGHKIGFSSHKYLAALLVGLTNRKAKEISKGVKVSYNVLRKWKTEADFKTEMENQAKEFSQDVVNYLRKHVQGGNVDPGYVWVCATAFSQLVVKQLLIQGMMDVRYPLQQRMERGEMDEAFVSEYILYNALDTLTKNAQGTYDLFNPAHMKERADMLEFAAQRLSKKTVTEKDKKFVLTILTSMAGALNNLADLWNGKRDSDTISIQDNEILIIKNVKRFRKSIGQ